MVPLSLLGITAIFLHQNHQENWSVTRSACEYGTLFLNELTNSTRFRSDLLNLRPEQWRKWSRQAITRLPLPDSARTKSHVQAKSEYRNSYFEFLTETGVFGQALGNHSSF
jgi:hypothetical protein